jgi:Uma2 family endonuclease
MGDSCHPDTTSFSSGLMATSQTTPASSQAIATTVPSIARFSIRQYDRMIDAGVFECEPRQRVELLEGVLRRMTPIGHEHENAVDWLARWSFENTEAGEVRI